MLFAYGAANVAAAFTGSLVTGNSPSRSAAMDASGARSQLPSLVAAGTIAVVHALLHRPAGVPAHRGAGRDRGQRGAVADRGPRAARAVAHAPLGVLDRRRLPAERAGAGSAARRGSSPSSCPRSTSSGGRPARRRRPSGSPRRQPLRAPGRRAGLRAPGLVRVPVRRPALLRERDPASSTTSSGWPRTGARPVRWFVLDAEAMVDVDTTGAGALRQAITMLTGGHHLRRQPRRPAPSAPGWRSTS